MYFHRRNAHPMLIDQTFEPHFPLRSQQRSQSGALKVTKSWHHIDSTTANERRAADDLWTIRPTG